MNPTNTPPQFFEYRPFDLNVPGAVRIDDVGGWHAPQQVRCTTCANWIPVYWEGTELTACVERGRTWPDFAWAGSGGRFDFVQARVVDELRRAGISGFHVVPVRFTEITSKRLTEASVPSYFWMDVRGYTPLDLSAYGSEVWACSTCGLYRIPNYTMLPTPPDANRWDGSDTFGSVRGSMGPTYCTRRFLELAHQDRWTGLEFIPADIPWGLPALTGPNRWRGIDYLREQWPPDSWYPRGYHPPGTDASA